MKSAEENNGTRMKLNSENVSLCSNNINMGNFLIFEFKHVFNRVASYASIGLSNHTNLRTGSFHTQDKCIIRWSKSVTFE